MSLARGQLALDAVDVDGNEAIDSDDLKGAIASEPTSKVLGIRLWWVDYGLYQHAILEKDLQRIERYYHARGFFEVRVRAGRVVHAGARSVKVQIVVEEGPRVRIGALLTQGWEALPNALRARLLDEWKLALEAPFDEDEYVRAGQTAERVLAEEGYAHASVKMGVEVDLVTHRATVRAELDAGPICTFGVITVVGLRELSEGAVRLVLALEPGKPYSTSKIRSARDALFELGLFDTVQVEPNLVDRTATSVPLLITVRESKLRSLKIGPGFLLDPLRDDVHLVASWEHRNLLGGLRDFTLSARPLLMFKPGLLSMKTARPGISTDALLRQPSFLEARTTGSMATTFAILPDPTNDYRTTSLRGSIGVDRRFGPSVALGLYYRRGFDFPVAYAGGYLPPNVLPGYLFTGAEADAVPAHLHGDARDASILRHSLNAAMLRGGAAYPLLYDTQPAEHRALFAALALRARHAGVGLWPHDRSEHGLPLAEIARTTAAPLVWPKLFRRVVDFLRARADGFHGTILDWLDDPLGGASGDDRFTRANGTSFRLHDALQLHDGHVGLTLDSANTVCHAARPAHAERIATKIATAP